MEPLDRPMNYNGYTAKYQFYAPNCGTPGTFRIAVGYGTNPWRSWMEALPEGYPAGWTPKFDFCAFPDDLEYDKLEYKLDMVKLGAAKPKAVVHFETTNNTPNDQQATVSKTYTVTTTSKFEHHFGVKVGVTASCKVGVPGVGEGEVSVSAETSYDFTSGKEHTDSEELQF